MIRAGVNVTALSTFMAHANIRITLDQYGHLLPGAEDEAARPGRRLPRSLGRRDQRRADCSAPRRKPVVGRVHRDVIRLERALRTGRIARVHRVLTAGSVPGIDPVCGPFSG
jgi:hypothetical protein